MQKYFKLEYKFVQFFSFTYFFKIRFKSKKNDNYWSISFGIGNNLSTPFFFSSLTKIEVFWYDVIL